jgi:sugar lactone lactonase YvrE
LEYFTQEDAVFFYGRTALTDELIDKVRTQNFIAVLGASGSGKSSVLRAGLLDQLKRGQKLSGSDRWTYYDPFTPGEHPLASLKNAFGKEAQELSQFIARLGFQTSPSDLDPPQLLTKAPVLERGENSVKVPLLKGDLGGSPGLTTSPTVETERVVLVIDQFEECFTMCQDSQEREEFFNCLLETLEKAKHKLCLVLGMRADFLGKCAEYAELAQKIDQHLVMVKPMTRQEIEEAITKPAELVDLQVEKALVTKMTEDVVESPGSLPLLQYTLTQLWKDAQTGANRNRLTQESYNQLGGIEKTLPKRANQVYASLKDQEKSIAKRIFLELTQLGETSDTRRRVYKEDLVNSQHSEELLDRTIEQLVQAKLIVTTHESQSQNAKPGVILDIVHEALIRHWQELRQWVAQNQVALEIERKIEARAKDWERNGKTEDLGLLLQGATLIEAETYLKDYGNLGLLDGIAQEYIQVSQIVRDRLIKEDLERKQRELKAVQTRNRILIGSLGVVSAVAVGAFFLWQDTEKQRLEAKNQLQAAQRQETIARLGESAAVASNLLSVTPLEGLMRAIQATGESQASPQEVREKTFPQVQSSLYDAIDVARERNILKGHESDVNSVAFSPDGKTVVSGSADNTIRLWDTSGKPIGQPFKGHQSSVNSVAFSRDGKTVVSGSFDGTIRLWDTSGKPIGQPFKGHESVVISVAFSPDGKTVVSGSEDNTIRLWDTSGKPIGQPFKGHQSSVNSVAFSRDGKTVVSGSADNTIRLWDTSGKPIAPPFKGHEYQVSSVAFSRDGKTVVSGSEDNTIRLWDTSGKPIAPPFKGHQSSVNSVAFSRDGKTVVSGSEDKTIRLWRGGTWQDWLGVACDRLIDHPILVDPKTTLAENSEMIEVAKGASETCQNLVWNPAQKAHFLANQGRAIGQGGDFKGAMAKFQEARKLSPSLDIPSEAEVERWVADTRVEKVEKVEELITEGKFKEALAAYQKAQRLKPTWKLSSESWNTLCWYGSLHGQAAEVMQACENAVMLAPKVGEFRDSRGVARAMTGNTAGAIEDFQAYINSTDSDDRKKQRQGWIDTLKAGKNPFTKEEIEGLLQQ